MSIAPYWLRRRLMKVASQDPIYQAFQDVVSKDPFFQDPVKYMRSIITQAELIDGVTNSEVKMDSKKAEVHLDVQNFSPEEIHVKTVGNEITIEGRREIKRKDGWTRSHFERRFILPDDFPPERVECHLDKGKLVLVAFRSEPLAEREVPILVTEKKGAENTPEEKTLKVEVPKEEQPNLVDK